MKNEWITIEGRQVLYDEFIYALDNYRFDVLMDYNESIHRRFCRMISQLQIMADTYHNSPEKWPTESRLKRMKDLGFSEIENNQLPEAIDEAFGQMKRALGINLDKMLSECEEKSKIAFQRKLAAEEKENRRLEECQRLADVIRERDNQSEIDFLIAFQKAKDCDPEYEALENEWQVTELLCQICVCRAFMKNVPIDILYKVHDLELIGHFEVEKLLTSSGYEYDYKCYQVDCTCDSLYEETIIPLDVFCEACKPMAEKILGIECEFLSSGYKA